MVKGLVAALGVFAIVVATPDPAAAVTAGQKCASAKIKAAGKKAACLLSVYAGGVAKGLTPDPLKLGKCRTKMSDPTTGKGAFEKADAKGCIISGDGQTIENKVDAFVDGGNGMGGILAALHGTGSPPTASKCQAAKLKAVGKNAACQLALKAKEAAGGGLDMTKVQKCEDKMSKPPDRSGAFEKAEDKGPDCTTNDDGPTIEGTVDGFVADVFMEIPSSCPAIVVGQPIPNTYKLSGTTGEKRCTTNAASNRFGTCTTDGDCGGTSGACLQLPWVTADGQVMSFPTGTQTTFTVAAEGPMCEHQLCIPCGNPHAACAGIPGCEVAGNPNGCVPRGTQGCCDQPGFIVPTFVVNILGGLCSRVDQIDCGLGVVNTSNPQTGDNEVTKNADTSDPGPDCMYGTSDDPPPPASCTAAGNDYAGKIVRTIGNGSADADGIQFRLTTPELSTTWFDSQNPCPDGSTFDNGEGLVSQIVIKAEPTSAGASGAFTEQNGDGCKRAGAGFISNASPSTDGPITVPGAPAGPARPQSYDGTQGAVTTAVSEVFSGLASPIHDIGFVAITPNMPAVVVPAVQCSCTETPGCPE